MVAAARGNTRQAPPDIELTARRAAPDVRLDPKRPLPYPEPVGINDNADEFEAEQPLRQAPRTPRRRLGFLQLVAWILVAPLYLLVAAGSIAVVALFVTRFFAA